MMGVVLGTVQHMIRYKLLHYVEGNALLLDQLTYDATGEGLL